VFPFFSHFLWSMIGDPFLFSRGTWIFFFLFSLRDASASAFYVSVPNFKVSPSSALQQLAPDLSNRQSFPRRRQRTFTWCAKSKFSNISVRRPPFPPHGCLRLAMWAGRILWNFSKKSPARLFETQQHCLFFMVTSGRTRLPPSSRVITAFRERVAPGFCSSPAALETSPSQGAIPSHLGLEESSA